MKKLYRGSVYHERFEPKTNRFKYPVYSLRFDLDQIDQLNSKYLSVNRRNLFSFYQSDHGYRDGSCLKKWAHETLIKAEVSEPIDKIVLQTFPRVLGYVFNPVSFWFCYQKNELKSVICEVNNTFGETHCYVVRSPVAHSKKVFHVSPFYSREGHYKFDFTNLDEVKIDYYSGDRLLLKTGLKGQCEPLTDKLLLKEFFKNPLYTFFVVFRIHFQAIRLLSKRVRFFKKPTPIQEKVTSDKWPKIHLA